MFIVTLTPCVPLFLKGEGEGYLIREGIGVLNKNLR